MPSAPQQTAPPGRCRARALGIPLDGRPGPNDAITDVERHGRLAATGA